MKMQFDSGVGERSSRIFDSLPEAILFFNLAGELRYVNSAGLALIGQEARNRRFCDIADCGQASFRDLIDDIRSRMVGDQVVLRLRPDKGGRRLYLNVVPVDGGAICTLTDRKAAAPENESMYRAIYYGAMEAIFVVDPRNLRILSMNSTAEDLTGYRCPELEGRAFEEIVAVPDRENARRVMSKATADSIRTKYVDLRRKDGTSVPAEMNARCINFDSRRVIVSLVRDIYRFEHPEDEAAQLDNELSALNYIGAIAGGRLGLHDALDRAIRLVCKVKDIPAGRIYLLDRATGELRPEASFGMDLERSDKKGTIRPGECVEGLAVSTGEPIVVEDLGTWQGPACDRAYAGRARSLVSVPVSSRGMTIGVMDLATPEKRPFTPRDVRFFTSVAGIIGVMADHDIHVREMEAHAAEDEKLALEMQRQADELRRNYELLRRITQSINLDDTLESIVKNVPILLRLDGCVIYRLEEREIRSVRATESITKKFGTLRYDLDRLVATREAVDKRRTIVVNDALNYPGIAMDVVRGLNIRAMIILPLIARGKTLGVMWLLDTATPRKFSDVDIQRSNMLSDQVAIAIDNAMLFRQLSEANRQLEDSYDRLKNLDSMKMEFFTLLSHELRTPLTTIKGYADLLQDGVLGPLNEEQRDKLARISAGVDRLTKIVENLSDLSSIASKKYVVDIIPVSLNDLINEVVKGMAFLAESKGIDITTDVPLNLPIVYVDRARIMQVVLNILNNAIKYTPSGGHVTIRARDEPDHVLVSVHDTGIGIPRRDLENIFSGFYHSGYKLSYEYKGAGLGLALSRGIVESHGGHIWAESEVGKGSTFYFTLPKNAPLKQSH
ncbi:MAG: adaptive-response sensory kinase [Methanocella sp. PtaU1.Bin125]|nr:MAG: adaptive-response sensory kinase [Methanocella sp. PtaU1.Bin125]